jgi:formate hydrogenlyase subunit 4
MMHHALIALYNVLLVLLLAPLFEGILRKVTARVQSRKGPPLFQPYMDLAKLLIKEDIEVGHSPVLQRFAALLALVAPLTTALFIPMGFGIPLSGFGDGIVVIYVLTLGGIAVLLAALAAGSTYSLIGMSREMMSMMLLEPIFAVAILMAASKGNSLRLETLFGGAIYAGPHGLASGLLLLVVIVVAFQAFIGRLPFDTSEAETEIMEGPMVEYSGPKLALFKYARMAKLVVYSGLVLALFVPPMRTGFAALDALVFIALQTAILVFVTLLSATHARIRIDRAVRTYALLFAFGTGALVLSLFGF